MVRGGERRGDAVGPRHGGRRRRAGPRRSRIRATARRAVLHPPRRSTSPICLRCRASPGYRLRHVEPHEARERAAVHAASWSDVGPSKVDEQAYRQVMARLALPSRPRLGRRRRGRRDGGLGPRLARRGPRRGARRAGRLRARAPRPGPGRCGDAGGPAPARGGGRHGGAGEPARRRRLSRPPAALPLDGLPADGPARSRGAGPCAETRGPDSGAGLGAAGLARVRSRRDAAMVADPTTRVPS